jgi:hypothetical protein
MMGRLLVIVAGLFAAASVLWDPWSLPSQELAAAKNAAAADDIGRVEIVGISSQISIYVRLSPHGLEQMHHHELEMDINHLSTDAKRQLIAALVNTSLKDQRIDGADVRLRATFYTRKTQRKLATFYFDGVGVSGYVGDTPVVFESDLFRVLLDIAPIFK